jgi:MFS family permease
MSTLAIEESKVIWYRDYRWMIVFIMLLGAVINYLDRVNLSMANTTIRAEFGLTDIQVGFLLSAFMWPYALANLPAGWMIDKFGINKIFIWSLVLWSLATLAGGFAIGFFTMYVTRFILGITEAPFFIIGGKITQRYFNPKERGTASSIINLGPKLANGFAPPLLTFLIIYLGWRGMFITLGIAGLFVVLLWIKCYQKNDEKYVIPEYRTEKKEDTMYDGWALFNHPTTWWFNLGNIGSSYLFWLYFTWLPTYLIEERHLSLKSAGWATAIPFLAGVVGVPVGGYISDILIKRGMNVIRARIIPTVGGCLLAGITVIPVNYVNSINTVEILFTISTFAVSARVGVLWALVGDVSPKETVGIFGGIQNFANFMGGMLVPIGTGIILQYISNYNIVFIVSGIFCILASFCYAMIRRPILSEEIAVR